MKVRVTKESIRRYAENYIWWSDVPDFIELDADPVEKKCVHKRITYSSQSHAPYCLDCDMYLPASPSFPIIEELDGLQKYNVLDLALKFNEIIHVLNTMRK